MTTEETLLRGAGLAVTLRGRQLLRQAGILVEQGLMAAEAAGLNPGFIRRMEQGRPWVRCKLAMSLDGRTAMASGESKWITGPAARRDVHRLRARSDAIVTGIGTVLADDPQLSVRLVEGPHPQPVVLDSRLRTPGDARLLQGRQRRSWLVGAADNSPARVGDIDQAGAEVLSCPRDARSGRLDLPQTLALLRPWLRFAEGGGAEAWAAFAAALDAVHGELERTYRRNQGRKSRR